MTSERLAKILILSGLIPFLATLLVFLISPVDHLYHLVAPHFFVIYGSIILSFIGGIHWGLGLKEGKSMAIFLYLNSNVSALIAFASAILASSHLSLAFLAVGFSSQWFVDCKIYQHKKWFLNLRTVATISVLLMITILALTW